MKNLFIAASALALPLTALAAPSGLEDVAKVTKRDDGKYDVECTYGGVEKGVSVEALKSGKVCQLGEMRNAVAFRKFETAEACVVTSFNHVQGVTGTQINVAGMTVDSKNMFANCKMNVFYSIPAGYQIGIKKASLATSLNEYEGDPIGFVFASGENEKTQIQNIEVSKQGANSYELEFEGYVFTGCSKGPQEAQKLNFEIMLAPSQGAITAGSAALTGFSYTDIAIQACDAG